MIHNNWIRRHAHCNWYYFKILQASLPRNVSRRKFLLLVQIALCKVVLENLTVTQLVKNFPASKELQGSRSVHKLHWTLHWPQPGTGPYTGHSLALDFTLATAWHWTLHWPQPGTGPYIGHSLALDLTLATAWHWTLHWPQPGTGPYTGQSLAPSSCKIPVTTALTLKHGVQNGYNYRFLYQNLLQSSFVSYTIFLKVFNKIMSVTGHRPCEADSFSSGQIIPHIS
jgi:hypothetical protein